MNEILANLQQEGVIRGDEPFAKQEEKEATEPSAPPAEKPEEKEPSQEGKEEQEPTENSANIPFHKHPDWIKRERKHREELESLKSEFSEEIKQLRERVESPAKSDEKAIPSWFKDAYGDDRDKYAEYQNDLRRTKEEAKAEALRELEARQENAKKAEAKQVQWVNDQLEELKADGKTFEKNALLKVAYDYMPTDENGNISFEKAYDIYEKMKPVKSSAEKKKVAAATTSESSSEPKVRKYKTPEDLKGKGWYIEN